MDDINVITFRTRFLIIVNYCYVIVNKRTSTALLVDPAWNYSLFRNYIESHQLKLTGILLTHHHFDHINLANRFARNFEVPVYMSKREIDFYRFKAKNLCGIEQFDKKINLGGIECFPILTPGHTCGSVCYLVNDHFFSGDTLFIEGCGICSGWGGDPGMMFDSIQNIKSIISSNTLICPGHCFGEPLCQRFQSVYEKNIYLHFDDRKKFIDFRMRSGQSGLFSFK